MDMNTASNSFQLWRKFRMSQMLLLALLAGIFSLATLLAPSSAEAVRTITISDAADPANYNGQQGATTQLIDNLSVTTSGSGAGVTITNFYVTTTGTTNISAVYVKDATGATTYGSQTVPAGNIWTISSATVPSNPGGTFTVYLDVKATATLSATLTAKVSSFDWTSGTGTVATDTAGTTLTVTAPCIRNTPLVTITTTNKTITADGGSATYSFTVTNNDSASCGSSTFTLAAADSNLTNYNATSGPTSGSVTLAAGAASASINYTVNAKVDQTAGTNTTTISASEASHTTGIAASITTLSVSGSPLNHNSDNVGTTYGTWGTAYSCTTCHSDDNNIKLVNTIIGTPIGNRPVVFMQITASGSAAAVMGNDQRTAFQNGSRNVCEVCHHKTTVHNYSASKVGADKNHKSANNDDCTRCHAHKAGFKAVCDTCHGNPPIATTIGGPNGLVSPATTVLGASPTDPGAHDKHVTLEGMGCNTCHNNNTNHQGSNVLIGFAINPSNVPGFVGTVPATPYASYSGNSGAVKPPASSDAGTLVRNTASTNNSCNVYCHGNWAAANGSINPRWATTTGQADCGTCHAASASRPPQTGTHTTHASNSAGNYGFSCTKCHPNVGSGASVTYSHIDGSVQWRLSSATTNGLVGTSAATYKALNSGSTGAVAPSPSFGSCTNIYCHSTAQGSTGSGVPSSFASPTWGGAAAGCSSCHLDMSNSASATGDHVKHAQSYGFACGQCHNGYTATTITTATHVNRNIELDFSAGMATATTYSKTNSFIAGSAVYGNCTNSYCHSTANGPTGSGTVTYTTPIWGSTTTTCGSCHVDMYTNASAPGDHVKHAKTYRFACSVCHGSGYTNSAVPTGAGTRHVNKFINVSTTGTLALGTVYSKGPRFAPNSAYGTCSTSYCHSTGQSTTGGATPTYPGTPPTWGTTTTNCGSCHVDMSSSASGTGDHPKHASSTGNAKYGCAVCHGLRYGAALVNSTTHVNKTIEISFTKNAIGTTYSQGSSTVGDGFGYCSTSKCHGQGYPIWGGGLYSATIVCENCHGSAATNPFYSTATGTAGATPTKVTAATDAKVGAHTDHLTSGHSYANDVACYQCHKVPTLTNMTSHYRTGSALVNFSSMAKKGGLTPTYSAGTCNNIYCHGDSLPQFSTTQPAVTWNSTTYLTGAASTVGNASTTRGTGDCAACHCFPPLNSNHLNKHTGGTATQASDCAGCHSHVNAQGTGFGDVTKHIDGAIEATGGHSTPYYGSPHNADAGTSPFSGCSCHTNTKNVAYPFPQAVGVPPDCQSCHTKSGPIGNVTTGCGSCHGSTNGRPTGSTYPDRNGQHSFGSHSGQACTVCHAWGTGSVKHGWANRKKTFKTYSSVKQKLSIYTVNAARTGTNTRNSGDGTCSGSVSCCSGHGSTAWY